MNRQMVYTYTDDINVRIFGAHEYIKDQKTTPHSDLK